MLHDLKGKTKYRENKAFVTLQAGRYLMLQTLIILKKPKLRKEERLSKVNLVVENPKFMLTDALWCLNH